MNPICVALDHENPVVVKEWASAFGSEVGLLKVGLEAYYRGGNELIADVSQHGEVFADLKLYDIPNTVAGAARAIASLGVSILNVHASGGGKMIEAVVKAAPNVKIIGVTVLTSLDQSELSLLGQDDLDEHVDRLAEIALNAGAAGYVCAPSDLPRLRKKFGSEPIAIVPGIRPAGSGVDDQKRVATPRDAMDAGATYIVIGRPITRADNPLGAIHNIHKSLG